MMGSYQIRGGAATLKLEGLSVPGMTRVRSSLKIDGDHLAVAGGPQGFPHRDAADPGAHGRRLSQAGKVAEDGHEGLLGGIVGGAEGDGAADTADIGSEFAQERVQSPGVASLGAANELLHDG